MSLESDFKSPSSEFRGKPFWAWNGKLKKEELVRQLGIFKEMGMGGAFMHARVGLGTAYLSDEWFDLIDACARKCEKEGMQAWLYDEDRWPSGAAGGLVTKDERYRMRFLRLDVLKDAAACKADGKEIALFAAKVEKRAASGARRLALGSAIELKKGESLLVFKEELHPCTSWYNGYTYLDTMNEEAVDKFIEVTHAQYLKRNGKDFGKTIPGIFADEPHYGHGRNFDLKKMSGTVQWTGKLPEAFKSRYGYELTDKLPELFFIVDGAKFSQVRHDFYDCVTHLFVNAFGRKIYEFCEKAGIDFTGHILEEPTLISQTQAVGAAMRFYEYMQAPGIDILGPQGLDRKGGRVTEISTAKQVESMRRQFGRKRFLSELYGCTGWNFTFAEHKAVGDWQAAMGVNLRCQHLAWYTMEGEAKRDYPASISFQSAWHKDYRTVEDYFSRVNGVLSHGEAVRDIAVLHPIESCWGSFLVKSGADIWTRVDDTNKIPEKLNEEWFAIQNALLAAHEDFDYIDEEIISRHGSVDGSALKVGKASYKAVVVPPILCARESTAKLLGDFVKAGGKLFIVESPKEFAALEQGGALDALKASGKTVTRAALAKALAKTGVNKISVRDAKTGKEYPDCVYMLRRDEKAGTTTVFLVHSVQKNGSADVEVEIPAAGKAFEFDALSGRVFELKDAKSKDGATTVKTVLEPYGSKLFVIEDKGRGAIKADAVKKGLKKVSAKALNFKDGKFELLERNAISLDSAEYCVNNEKGWFNGPFDVLKLDRVVRDALGLPYRSGDMVQPWARKPVPGAKEGREVKVSFRFKVETVPSGKVWLALERPCDFSAIFNNEELALKPEGNWLDNSIYKVALPQGSLKQGWNQLILTTNYTADSGFEMLYLVGDFGAKRDSNGVPVLTAAPEKLGFGDWSKFNLESYTGAMGYFFDAEIKAKKSERVFLKLGKWEGVSIRVFVDGKDAGAIAWPPYELDITEAVAGKKKAKIEVRVYSGRRNLLGPLHLAERNPGWTGPGEFVASQDNWSPLPQNFCAGLLEAPVLTVKA